MHCFSLLQSSSGHDSESTSGDPTLETSTSEYRPSSTESDSDWESAVVSDEFSSGLECFEAHYLEEELERPPPDTQPYVVPGHNHGNLYDPDDQGDPGQGDPDNPYDPGYEEQQISSSSEDLEDGEDGNVQENKNEISVC